MNTNAITDRALSVEKHELLELEILKHVEQSSQLNNRMAAAKLDCSVKLAHAVLARMVEKGWLHVRKLHARRWDYFLTPTGIAEKARLTYEFLEFSMRFYQEARKKSSQVCRDLAEEGKRSVALLGDGDLAEIVYLGVQEWGLRLVEVYGDDRKTFLGHVVKPPTAIAESQADAIIVCEYDKSHPMTAAYWPESLPKTDKLRWVFAQNATETRGAVNA